jgi:hypothetical protein
VCYLNPFYVTVQPFSPGSAISVNNVLLQIRWQRKQGAASSRLTDWGGRASQQTKKGKQRKQKRQTQHFIVYPATDNHISTSFDNNIVNFPPWQPRGRRVAAMMKTTKAMTAPRRRHHRR